MPTQKKTFGAGNYIEYRSGTLNVILSIPHGGTKRPQNIPDRDAGYISSTGEKVYDHNSDNKDYVNCPIRYKKDEYTQELGLMVADELHKITGKWPHVVLNHLYRGKMDANCDMAEATFHVPEAQRAWSAYHKFIDQAKVSITGRGLFLDIHGHKHDEGWVELGYLITGVRLDSKDYNSNQSSVRSLAEQKCKSDFDFSDLLYGPDSFGALLNQEGYKVVPSPAHHCPNGKAYYSGRYNITRHGSRDGGMIDAIQIESPKELRNKDKAPRYAKVLAKVISQFLLLHYTD